MHAALMANGLLRQPFDAGSYYFTPRLPLVQGEVFTAAGQFSQTSSGKALFQGGGEAFKMNGPCPTTNRGRALMLWTTPTLVEVCIGLEINGYLPAEF